MGVPFEKFEVHESDRNWDFVVRCFPYDAEHTNTWRQEEKQRFIKRAIQHEIERGHAASRVCKVLCLDPDGIWRPIQFSEIRKGDRFTFDDGRGKEDGTTTHTATSDAYFFSHIQLDTGEIIEVAGNYAVEVAGGYFFEK